MITDVHFEDFIGIFDTEFDPTDFIEYFEHCKETGVAFDRRGFTSKDKKLADTRRDACLPIDYFMDEGNAPPEVSSYMIDKDLNSTYLKRYNRVLNMCMNEYAGKYERLTMYNLQSAYLNIQRTRRSEGYHAWHSENSSAGCTKRVLAHMMYLNDITEGGETEFLYLGKRFTPIKGRLLIWPAGFTHTHRGNPPLSGDKYVATGWVENANL
tara:strand:- start:1660 stop:2292 length:633 start_codon:yes stop_codon:yes gene_type:complete